MAEVRPTQDVDVIVEVASRVEYYRLEEALRTAPLFPEAKNRHLSPFPHFYLFACIIATDAL